MVTIHRTTDRIPVRIAELTFWLAPLSHSERNRLLSATRQAAGAEVTDAMAGVRLALKLSLKQADGMTCLDGSPYELEFEPGGQLTDECVEELMQLDLIDRLVRVSMNWGCDGVKPLEEMRRRFETRIASLVSIGKLSEDEAKLQLESFVLDGVEIDLTKVKNVKKKLSETAPAP